MLSREQRAAIDYLGSSHIDVRSTIEEAAKKTRYKWFLFKYALSPVRVYHLECEWYHRYSPLNAVHPRPPRDDSGFKCPISECDYDVSPPH
jgi:hypothetical protein